MSFAETALLGAIAGITIYLGLPVGRLRRIDERMRGEFGITHVTLQFECETCSDDERIVCTQISSR